MLKGETIAQSDKAKSLMFRPFENLLARVSGKWRSLSNRPAASLIAFGLCIAPAQALDLTVGALLELTGPLSAGGPSGEKAAVLALKVANQAAKDAGVKATVSLAVADAQGDPQSALSAARTLVDRKASCILGPATTPEAITVLKGVTMQRKITLWPLASSTRLRTVEDGGTVFRTVPPDDLQAEALSSVMQKYIGGQKSVAIIYRNEPYGEALSKAFAINWKAGGGRLSAVISFDPQQEGLDSEAGQAVAGNPDAYLVIDYPETYAKLGAALARTGKFDPKKLFVADTLSFPTVPESIPAQSIDGAFGVVGGSPKGTGAYSHFGRLWKEAGGVDNASYTANIFDSAILCFLSAIRAGSSEPGRIRDNVRKVTEAGAPQFTFENLAAAIKVASTGREIDYVGVSGEFRFAPNGDTTSGLYDIFRYQNGRQIPVEQISVR